MSQEMTPFLIKFLGHVNFSSHLGLLLQYFITRPIKKALVKSLLHITYNVSDVSDMFCMLMKLAEPREKVAPHRNMY